MIGRGHESAVHKETGRYGNRVSPNYERSVRLRAARVVNDGIVKREKPRGGVGPLSLV